MLSEVVISKISYRNLEDIGKAASKIIEIAANYKIWLFYGTLGAGKTTMIKEICHIFNIEDRVVSPTFSIINEYRNSAGEIFYHFDFYRINSLEEAEDLGCEEYFESGNPCFVEWPQIVLPLVPGKKMEIVMEAMPDASRNLLLKRYE